MSICDHVIVLDWSLISADIRQALISFEYSCNLHYISNHWECFPFHPQCFVSHSIGLGNNAESEEFYPNS